MNQAYKNKLKNTFLNTKVHSECLYKTIVNELFLVIWILLFRDRFLPLLYHLGLHPHLHRPLHHPPPFVQVQAPSILQDCVGSSQSASTEMVASEKVHCSYTFYYTPLSFTGAQLASIISAMYCTCCASSWSSSFSLCIFAISSSFASMSLWSYWGKGQKKCHLVIHAQISIRKKKKTSVPEWLWWSVGTVQ